MGFGYPMPFGQRPPLRDFAAHGSSSTRLECGHFPPPSRRSRFETSCLPFRAMASLDNTWAVVCARMVPWQQKLPLADEGPLLTTLLKYPSERSHASWARSFPRPKGNAECALADRLMRSADCFRASTIFRVSLPMKPAPSALQHFGPFRDLFA